VTLPDPWYRLLDEACRDTSPLDGDFFRSVEIRHAHPDDVISGEGAKQYGGRFARPGIRAVYLSCDEETATREVTARKERLRGRSQITLKDYPRVIYVVHVKLSRCVDLAKQAHSPKFDPLVTECLSPDLKVSCSVGDYLRTLDIQGILFPSAAKECSGRNLVVFPDVGPKRALRIVNRDQIVALFKEWAQRM
jgi:RES domain-containing protein